jgi:DNA mismatch repair ATPase MutS
METGELKNDYQQLLQWTAQPSLFSNDKLIRVLIWVIPAITILALIATFFIPQAKLLLMIMIITQWSITGSKLKKINTFHDYIGRKKNILQKYSRLLLHVETEKFTAEKLQTFSAQAHQAHERINALASLVSALDARTNSMTTLVVNSLLLYDLQCVYRLEKWKQENSGQLRVWLDTITEIEALNSFGTYSSNNPGFCFASICPELKITATDMAHPLLGEDERIVNSMTIGPDATIMIITGANMAGKSTFLRTLGVNVVLALNGAPVCASHFSCPILEMRSGMRTADSLKDHQSYFYAELNRLKSIMDELRRDKPLLILLDEILKGTNSNDKQAGSIALVRQLLPHPCLALIATHDLALGELEKEYPQRIRNYCFEANIENEQLSFDYKLKTGVAQKMNASFLMRKMGIIPA